ncbi:hypothetical protein D3C79_404480 [compost metagenome]
MEAGHHGFAAGALYHHGLHIHRNVDHADSCAEQQQGQRHAGGTIHQRQQGEINAQCQAGEQDHRAAAQPSGQIAGQRHGQHGAGTDAQQQQAQRPIINTDPRFGKRYQRRPGGHAETGDKKGQTRGYLRRDAGFLLFIAQGRSHVGIGICCKKCWLKVMDCFYHNTRSGSKGFALLLGGKPVRRSRCSVSAIFRCGYLGRLSEYGLSAFSLE